MFRKINNTTVRAALEAWQKGDAHTWLSLFSNNPEMTDDGHPRNFASFTETAIGHEYFTSIDKVENGGTAIFGRFHSDQWGNFKTFFKFHIHADGKIDRLDIGQWK